MNLAALLTIALLLFVSLLPFSTQMLTHFGLISPRQATASLSISLVATIFARKRARAAAAA